MKKQGILNSDISSVLSYMRHTDTLTVSDCGLPVPEGVKCIDLSVRFGLPQLMDVLREMSSDFKVEKITMSEDIKTANPSMLKEILSCYGGVEVEFIPHTEFKEKTKQSKAIIRTGESTLFANVILQSACIF
jgi:D-ribose pyranase